MLAADMGLGKTVMAVEVVRRLTLTHQTVLVICPLGTMVGWERTFRQQGVAVPIQRINSKVAGKTAYDDLKAGKTGIYLIGREYFRRFKWNSFKKVGVVIVDEYHAFTNRKSVGHKSLMTLKPEWRIGMSGTPWGNKFENAWAMAKWLWGYPVVSTRYLDFEVKYANTENVYLRNKVVTKVIGEKDEGRFVSELPCFLRPERPPHPIVYDKLLVELTPAQRKMYDDFESRNYVWLGEKALVEDLPIVVRIRLREMSLGTVSLNEDDEIMFADDMSSAKIDALKEFLSDRPDEPVIIFTHSKKFAKIVAKRIAGSRLWTGDTPHDEREELIEKFGVEFNYLVATVQAVAEGVDGLQHNCQTMVWLSRTENNMLNKQVERRIARPSYGEVKEVLCVDIMAADTYDEAVDDALYFTHRRNERSLRGKK